MWKKFVLAVALIAFAPSAHALPQAGDWDVSVSGTYGRAVDADENLWGGDIAVGYFFTDYFEASLEQGLQIGEEIAGERAWSLRTDALFTVTPFPASVIQPFIGAQIGVIYNDDDFDGLIGPTGGVKWFVTDRTYVSARYAYDYYFDGFEITSGNEADGSHRVNIGIGMSFDWF